MNYVPALSDRDSVDPSKYLREAERLVVPLVVLRDESEFGREVERALAQILEREWAAAVLTGRTEDPRSAVAQVAAVGFQQRLAPLRLWVNQAGWCAWFLDENDSSRMNWKHLSSGSRLSNSTRLEHIVFVRVKNAEAANHLKKWKSPTTTVVILSDCGDVPRPLSLLAEAAVALLYSSWKDHCQSGSDYLAETLNLTANSQIHVLGATSAEPDWSYHAWRWGRTLRNAILDEWRKGTIAPSVPDLETAKESVQRLLPRTAGWARGFFVVENRNSLSYSENPRIRVGETCLEVLDSISENDAQNHSSETEHTGRSALLRWLASIRDLWLFVRFATLPYLRRIAAKESTQMESDWIQRAREHLKGAQTVQGFLKDIENRLHEVSRWAKAREDATVSGGANERDFESSEKEAIQRIDALPNTVGLALRFTLIGLGLLWLVLAPSLRGGATAPWQSGIAHSVATLSAAFFLVLLIVALGHWLFFHWKAVKSVESVRYTTLNCFGTEISVILTGCMNRGGKKVQETVRCWQSDFEKLLRELVKGQTHFQEPKPQNRNPFFCGESLDSLLQERLANLVQEAHAAFVEKWIGEGSINFNPLIWHRFLTEMSTETARKAVNALLIGDCLKARNPSEQELQHLVADLAREAQMPSVNVDAPANPSAVSLISNGLQNGTVTRLPGVRVRPLGLRRMLAVALIPISKHS